MVFFIGYPVRERISFGGIYFPTHLVAQVVEGLDNVLQPTDNDTEDTSFHPNDSSTGTENSTNVNAMGSDSDLVEQ